MKCLSQESEYDSSEDEHIIKPMPKHENNPLKSNKIAQKHDEAEEPTLKPKFTHATSC